ncbi:MAG: COG1361 S-layer family protein [Nanoarchaeota archaeon]|nr:COG1361 S-layer family protein [Nanoarchaeota archaeon]
MNKKILVLGILLVLMSSFAFAATSNTAGNAITTFSRILITLVNQAPDPVQAGDVVTVRFKVENDGRQNAEDVVLELIPEYPFTLVDGEPALQKIGSVHGKQLGDIGVIVDYRLKVSENAIDGNHDLELRYKLAGIQDVWIKPDPFIIEVLPSHAILHIDSVTTVPSQLQQGSEAKLKVELANLASTFFRNIRVVLNLDGLPLATLRGTNEKIISYLDAGEKTTLEFNIIAEPDAASSLYKLPIELTYNDRLGNTYTQNDTVGIIIGGVPELLVYVDTSKVYSSSQTGSVTVRFVNHGVTDVKFLRATVLESKDYSILSQPEVYVGNVDSDDYETASYDLALERVRGSQTIIPLLLEYRDANNNLFEENVGVVLRLYSSSQAKSLGLKEGSGFGGFLIMLIIVGGGLYGYRRWKKKKK